MATTLVGTRTELALTHDYVVLAYGNIPKGVTVNYPSRRRDRVEQSPSRSSVTRRGLSEHKTRAGMFVSDRR